jgi:LPXTG-site transpeptidase (sortase) family protein
MVGFGLYLRDHSVFCLNTRNLAPQIIIMTSLQTLNYKKILVIFLIPVIVFYTLSSKNLANLIDKKEEVVLGVGEKVSVFQTALKPIYGTPKKIIIESLNLKIDVTFVGIDPSGYLETPKEWNVAGWYTQSARPGENGNMLVDGHYDDNYGRPAVFWKLKNLKPGDKVSVLDSYGRSYDYTVVDSYYVDINDPERLKVLEVSGNVPALTLITCGGVWNVAKHTYSDRLVVSAELVRVN